MLNQLDFEEIRVLYDIRAQKHTELRKFFDKKDIENYVSNALGISDENGNYSASEHDLGPKILEHYSKNGVYKLAEKLDACQKETHIPDTIYNAKILYLKISVGSEMAMMLRPNDFWVGNVRTIWCHLLIKHSWNLDLANEELELYRYDDLSSEMHYRIWKDIYLALKPSLQELSDLGNEEAIVQGVTPGNLTFLWADVIASYLFESY